jgi:RimJ/RimL family protein N-acetyltransferase
MTMQIPVLETDRLVLRGPRDGDFDAFADFCTTERSRGVGGPADRPEAWRGMAMMIGHWELRGYGMWWLESRASGDPVGRVGIWHPEGWPEPELGWVIYENFEGKGYAFEASVAGRDYAYQKLGMKTLISLISPDNARSITLAERLGAKNEATWTSPLGVESLIYRHPGPKPVK